VDKISLKKSKARQPRNSARKKVASSARVVATKAAAVETLASFPHGAFLENLTVERNGTIYFTSYFNKALMVLRPGTQAAPLAVLPAHPLGVLRTSTGFIVTAHAVPFTNAPAFQSSNEVLILDAAGTVTRTIKAADARFLNGLVEVAPDKVLIADSAAGLIWVLKPSTGELRPWLRDPMLAADPAAKRFRPGANGLKVNNGVLYVSNFSRGAIFKIALDSGQEASGAPTTFVQQGPVDDFAFAPDGSIYAATHGDTLLRFAPDGTVRAILETGCDSCTSVAVSGRGASLSLIVLTTGKLLQGGDAPARVLRVRPAR
jgi:sugar lactone lactonase YvrE